MLALLRIATFPRSLRERTWKRKAVSSRISSGFPRWGRRNTTTVVVDGVSDSREAKTGGLFSLPGLLKVRFSAGKVLASTTRPSLAGKQLPFEVDSAHVPEDVLVYSHKNDRFHKMLSVFGTLQFLFWSYLAVFSYKTLKDVPQEEEYRKLGIKPVDSLSWWRRINLGENKYRNGITLLCFSVGYIILFISWMYPMRAVRELWLLKGGNRVRVSTFRQTPSNSLMVPLNSINCLQSRVQAKSQIALKIRGKWFFYLMDKKGIFHNEHLFDYGIGLKRTLK